MGHLAIVNPETIERINEEHPFISIGGDIKKQSSDIDKKEKKKLPYKTVADLFADALAVRDGDIIFTWMINDNKAKGQGFDRYYIANGTVVFDPNDKKYPIKIGIKEGFQYEEAVHEEDALDILNPPLLWNAIGKKSLKRGRSFTHQTKDEDERLLDLLNKANNNSKSQRYYNKPKNDDSFIPISIENFGVSKDYFIDDNDNLNDVKIQRIIWNKEKEFLVEKALEAYLCENIDKSKVSFCSLLGHPHYHIEWFGNYLPYGVAGKNIDFVCEISKGDKTVVAIVELKKSIVSYKNYKQIINTQLVGYERFIYKAYKAYKRKKYKTVKVVLSHSPQSTQMQRYSQFKNTSWIGYDIDPKSGTVSFKRLL